MRILVITDIHANCTGLQAVLNRFGDADEIWCIGDLVEYGPSPLACIDLAREHCHRVVKGNHDVTWAGTTDTPPAANVWAHQWHSARAQWLRDLPETLKVEAEGRRWLLVHATPENPLRGILWPDAGPATFDAALAEADADVVICGHTHMAFVHDSELGRIINAGTVGQPRDGDYRAQCMMIEDGTAHFARVDYDLHALEREYHQSELPADVASTWFDYTRRGVVDVHGLQRGPFSTGAS